MFKPPSNLLPTVPRRLFCCGSLLPVCGVRVSICFTLCVFKFFGSVSVAEWLRFGKFLLIRLTICSLCNLTICYINQVNSRIFRLEPFLKMI